MTDQSMTGAEILLQALRDQGVQIIFGYPGGAVLPIYDALYQCESPRHVLARHEQGALHAAEGYARSQHRTAGVALVTSGPGATNAVTGIADAMMDSIPIVCISGQVATHLIGNDAFQEADTTGITRHCSKHNYLVKDVGRLAQTVHEAFHVALNGRPGPVVIDIPKDIQLQSGPYHQPGSHYRYRPQLKPPVEVIEQAVELLALAERPIIYSGGGVINSGPGASRLLTELVHLTGAPCTSTLMGLGALPGSDPQFLGMLGMHGTYQANLAMYHCDVMFAVGARFDDRVTGKLSAFSPGSRKIHLDIDPSSINKNVMVDIALVGDSEQVLAEMVAIWKERFGSLKPGTPTGAATKSDNLAPKRPLLAKWWGQIDQWRAVDCLSYHNDHKLIKPQYALERLREHIKGLDCYITTEVGQHQMWAAQFLPFEQPNRWLTSGGLGCMGYGLPAAIGCQMAHPDALVIDVAGEASVLMTIQELSTAVQHRAPVKIFILNNRYMGMVRQWQELLHQQRYAESYMDALPDFVKLAEAFGCLGLRVSDPAELDHAIKEMIESPKPVIMDVLVDQKENCFPMIPSGCAHNEMLLGREHDDRQAGAQPTLSADGLAMV